MSGITLIAGLGNPGVKYRNNRHNAGFWFVDRLAHEYGAELSRASRLHGASARVEIGGAPVWLFKPGTYMNQSGYALQAFVAFHKIAMEQVLIAHDEIDFPMAKVRLKRSGGHGGHNGLRDVISRLGAGFWRLRIGVGRPDDREQVVAYVLSDAAAEEKAEIGARLNCALTAVPFLARGEFDAAVNLLHR